MHTLRRFILTIAYFCLYCFAATAQGTISGKVVDGSGKSLPYANVVLKGTYDGASTDDKGAFSFTPTDKGNYTLVVSYLGFETYEAAIIVGDQPQNLTIKLLEKVTELNTVTISAGSFEASDKKKSVVLRPLDIVTTASANGDIYGAIATLPGATPNGEAEGLFVRGGSAVETKTIIDEMVVQNPYFSSVPDVPQRGRFSPFLFSGTVFSTGGYSAQYGQALSSTLVLSTEDLADQTRSSLGITMVGLSGGHTHRWEKASLSVDGSYTNLRPFFLINHQNRDWTSPPEGANGSLIFRQKTKSGGIFKFYSTYSQNNLGLRFPNLYDVNGPNVDFGLFNRNYYINTSCKESLGKNWMLFAGVSYSRNTDKLHIDSLQLMPVQKLGQGKITLTKFLSTNTNLKMGAEVQNPVYTFKITDPSFLRRTFKLNEIYTAGFAELELYLTQKLAARLGERIEYSKLLARINTAPRASLAYKTGKKSQVAFAYGMFYQTPERDELSRTTRLEFEKATHYIANYQYLDDKRTFRIEAYYKDYDNLVHDVRTGNPLADTLVRVDNSGYGYARGFEVFWRDKKTLKNVDYWISYSYLDTKRIFRYYPTLTQPTFSTPHTVNLVYKQFFAKLKTSLGATYTFATGRPYYSPVDMGFQKGTAPVFNNFSMNASYLTSIKGNFTVIFLGLNNVLGIKNVFTYRYDSQGAKHEVIAPTLRSFFIGMFISIGKQK